MKKTLAFLALLALSALGHAQTYPSPTYNNLTVQGAASLHSLSVSSGFTTGAVLVGGPSGQLTTVTTSSPGLPLISSGSGFVPVFTALTVAGGGTSCNAASGQCIDNISGFSGTGFLTRTGSATYAFQSLTNGITYGNLAQAGANTLLGNATGVTANVTAVSVTGCNGAAQALQWTNGTGFGCNSGIATSGANANITSLSGLTTPLSVSQGGTGGATLAQYQPLAGNGTGAITTLGTGTSGQVLTSNGSSAFPSFQALPGGRLIGVQVFASSGTYTPTSGTSSIVVEVQAPGGGSGSTAATAASQAAAAGGGGAGAYAKVRVTSGFSGASITIGSAGAAGGSGGSGGTGGTTSFGALVSCPGGIGGPGSASSAGVGLTTGSIAATAACTISGATTIISVPGQGGSYAFILNAGTQTISGAGANSMLGTGGASVAISNTASAGTPGQGYGSGASGAAASQSQATQAGAAGRPGVVIVWEFS